MRLPTVCHLCPPIGVLAGFIATQTTALGITASEGRCIMECVRNLIALHVKTVMTSACVLRSCAMQYVTTTPLSSRPPILLRH